MKKLTILLILFTSCQTEAVHTYTQADLTINYTHPFAGASSVLIPLVPIKDIKLTEGSLKIVYGCGVDNALTDSILKDMVVTSYFLDNKIEKVCP